MQLPPIIPTTDRATGYATIAAQWKALLQDETDAIAAMANFSALLKHTFNWHWVGFYRVLGEELVLGPFQGPVACVRIGKGKGVCGTAWAEDRTVVVPDVDLFPGHIACSPHSRSEIVVPCRDRRGVVVAVLDVDSSELDDFTSLDARMLETLCEALIPLFA
ncbi:MAG: GAF domain-containing protein [Flavobacteriales bacterium]|nr:GAF domain-containing protein [Flavobacteriales bacterium]